MKHIRSVLIFMLLFTAVSPQAIAAPQLTIGSAAIKIGGTASLNLSFSGETKDYAGLNAKIILPKGITVKSISKGGLLSANFITDFRTFSETANNGVNLIAYSGTDTFTASSGVLLTLNIEAAIDAPAGQHNVTFAATNVIPRVNSRYALAAKNAASVALSPVNGNIIISISEDADNDGLPDSWEQQIIAANLNDNIKSIQDVKPGDDFDGDGKTNLQEFQAGTFPARIKGDVNKDGRITRQDAEEAFNLSLKTLWTSEELELADYNRDGSITPQDAVDIFGASF